MNRTRSFLCILCILTFPVCNTPLSITEYPNELTHDLDAISTLEIVHTMNREDQGVACAVTPYLEDVAHAVDIITSHIEQGGRLIYIGAGTSGRLGVLDASECVPTFSAPQGQIVGIIAGGDDALRTSIESSEDSAENGIKDLEAVAINRKDVVCGISTSGYASYVREALSYAHELGCYTIMVTCNPKQDVRTMVDCFIAPEVGPEIITGSTRLKSGTATKMVLNMLTTATYVRLGKVYKNYMVDLQPVNKKLIARAKRILMEVLAIDEQTAHQLFKESGKNVKTAIVMHVLELSCQEAREQLQCYNGNIRKTLNVASTT